MKTENVNVPPSEQQVPAAKSKANKKNESDGAMLPILVEFTFTFSAVILSILFLTVTSILILSGAKLLDIVIRTSITMLVIGGLLILISQQIAQDYMKSTLVQEDEIEQKQAEQTHVESIHSGNQHSVDLEGFEKNEGAENSIPSEVH